MSLLEAEGRFHAFIEEVQKAVDAYDAIKVTKQPTRVGDMLPDMQLQELVTGKVVHCKNKLVVLTTEWLPWLQTSQRDSGYVLYILLIT